ncbi:MAG: hypothetical protein WB780_09760, partial [Candidatus Acidiferrales bacterium]
DSKEASLGRPAEKILWKKKDEFSLVALSVSLDYADAFIDALRLPSASSVLNSSAPTSKPSPDSPRPQLQTDRRKLLSLTFARI